MTWNSTGVTMDQISRSLWGLVVHRLVVDRTGVAGQFTFAIEFAKDESAQASAVPSDVTPPASASASVPAGASIFTVLERELGLKLEPIRASQGFLVVDRVERPRDGGPAEVMR
jgi:uncharacterized protein (TIGR03435 family)